MGKHTPGPWAIHRTPNDLDCSHSLYVEDKAICSVYRHPEAEAEANARLIAAAPDLYAALEAIADDFKHSSGDRTAEYAAIARAALAKATA